MTLDEFNQLPDDEVFARGLANCDEDGIFVTRIDEPRILKWVAKKGSANDFAVYCLWSDSSTWEDVVRVGDKISASYLNTVLNLSDEVWKLYRR